MPSFDAVSKVDLQEVDNAVNQTRKEVLTRYDFRGTKTEIALGDDRQSVLIRSADEPHVRSVYEVLLQKLAKREVSLRGVQIGTLDTAALGQVKATVTLQQGIPVEKAKELIALLKSRKMKVTASIQGDELRVSGKNRDDLQAAIALFRGEQDRMELTMQFINFRE